MRFLSVALGCVLTCTVLSVHSLTIGRSRVTALIGQPLEMVVPVQLDAAQGEGGICAEADVFHADSRQDPARVRVSTEPTAQPDTFNIRISSSALIDEPVVTVYLRTGCTQKSSRKFVLLADEPGESSSPQSRAADPVAPVVPTVVPVEATLARQRPPKPVAERQEVVRAPARTPATLGNPPTPPAAAKTQPAPASKPRLKLDPLEDLTERVKALESSAVALPPENTASGSQRMASLQNDVRALLEQAAKNEAAVAALRMRLEKAESDRAPMGVVYGLIALIVASLAGLGYLWSRRPPSPVWAQGVPLTPLQATQAAPERQPETEAAGETLAHAWTQGTTRLPQPDTGLDVNLIELDEEAFRELMNGKRPPAQTSAR